MNSKKVRTAAVVVAGIAGAAVLIGGVMLSGSSGRTPVVEAKSPAVTVTTTVPGGRDLTPEPKEQDSKLVASPEANGGAGSYPASPNNDSGNPAPAPDQPQQQPQQPQQPQPEPQQPQLQPQPQPEQPQPPVAPEEKDEEPEILQVPPQVVKTAPVHNSNGNVRSTKLSFTFTEPMDKASVNAAFAMVSPVVNGTISWNVEGTVMTFDPAADFDYGQFVEAKIAKSAKSAKGESMPSDETLKFRVMRISTVDLYSVASKDGHVLSPGVAALNKVNSTSTRIQVGTWSRGFLSFDLSVLPEDLINITDAELSVLQSKADAQSYGANTGNLRVESVAYGTLDAGDFSKKGLEFCWPVCAPLSALLSSNQGIGVKSTDVITFVKSDWDKRAEQGHLSQYRLRFEKENNGDGPDIGIEIHSSEGTTKPKLRITYTHP